jgi:DNA-binding HxlR family transcriptional regulator
LVNRPQLCAQAVIAIENARLLADLQERQRELARSMEELKSLGEVSRTVNSSLETRVKLRWTRLARTSRSSTT